MKVGTKTHVLAKTREYYVWQMMIRRCHNPREACYPDYGGRGISVCERWRNSVAAFVADMGFRPSDAHTIDRIDNDGNYEPDNCRWATRKEQKRNTRTPLVEFEYRGTRGTLTDLCQAAGADYKTVHQRIHKLQWPLEKALTTPVRKMQHAERLIKKHG